MNPKDIKLSTVPRTKDVARQKSRLLTEGQIEPILLNPATMSPDDGPHGWTYADAQILAAIELNRDNLLVTY